MSVEAWGRQTGIGAGTLKIIAMVTMLVDHIAAAVLVRYFYATGDWGLYSIYYTMRQIGRIAFPIYCFLLVEGAERTANRGRYLGRMAVFALISEIPFDLAFGSSLLEWNYQNVFFTLTIALSIIFGIEWIGGRMPEGVWRKAAVLAVAAAGMFLAAGLRTDYGWKGVACILILYFFRKNLKTELIMGYAAFVFLLGEITALPAFLLLSFYRGKKGFSCKYLFYGFYPVHLLLLFGICVLMGIAAYPAV